MVFAPVVFVCFQVLLGSLFLALVLWPKMFSSGAGSDTTDYSRCNEVPEVALRAMFQHEKLATKLRLALANKGLTTVRKFAMLGQTEERFESKIKAIMGPDLGSDVAEIEANVTFVSVV